MSFGRWPSIDALLWQIGRLIEQMPPEYAARLQGTLDWHAKGRPPVLHRRLVSSAALVEVPPSDKWSVDEIHQAMLDAGITCSAEREEVLAMLMKPVQITARVLFEVKRSE